MAIDPLPCPRPRVRCAGKFAHAYYPASYKDWKVRAAMHIEQAMRQVRREPLEGPVAVTIECAVEKPRTSKLAHPKPDIDNYAKAVLDAATQAGVWHDDAQVVSLQVGKRWAVDQPFIRILVKELT